MDSDEDAPPPPPPSSLPPGGEEEKAPSSSSEKFKALQNMLSSVPTMHSPQKDQASCEPAPPPSKRAHTEQENDGNSPLEASPQLKHTTKDRPRRKVRPPSRKGRSEGRNESAETKQLQQDEMLPEEAPPDLPPPPPPLSDLPTETSDHELEEENAPVESPPLPTNSPPAFTEIKYSPSTATGNHKLPPVHVSPEQPVHVMSGMLDNHRDVSATMGGLEEQLAPAPTLTPPLSTTSSSSPPVTDSPRSKGIVMGSFSERLKRIRENRSNKSQLLKGSSSPKTDSPLTRGSPSPKITTSLTGTSITERLSYTKQTSGSDLLVSSSPLTSFPTSPALSTQSTSSSLSFGGSTPPTSTTMQPMNNLKSLTEALKSKDVDKVQMDTLPTDSAAQRVAVVASSEVHVAADDITETPEQDKDDEVPTAPPPPIPDLPPPPDDLPLEMDSEETVDPPTQIAPPPVVNEPAKPATVTTKSSFRTIKKKEEWTRKSEELDSLMMNPLPLLISTKPSSNHPPDPLPEVSESPLQVRSEHPPPTKGEVELPANDDVLHDSAESLPSLPETPPPELPDGPPPDLPSSFSLDGLEFEGDEKIIISETLLIPPEDDIVTEENEAIELSVVKLDVATPPAAETVPEATESNPEFQPHSSPESTPPLEKEEQPPNMSTYGDKVQLRKPRRAANGMSPQDLNLQRRSAFDALVAVEPTSEEKKEPQLSAEQRRSLTLEASRRSDADTSPFLERWNISVPSSKVDTKEEKLESSTSSDVEELKKPVEAMDSSESKGVTVDVNSPSTEETMQDKDLLSIKELNQIRPKSIAGIGDLQPALKCASEDESRWSLPPDSEIFQSIPDSAPKLAEETKTKWKKSHLLTADGSTSLSASTGQLFSKGRDTSSESDRSSTGKSSSWRALHSSSESLPHFVGLRRKSPSGKQTQPLAVSPLAASISVASTSSKDGSVSQLNKEESGGAEIHQEPPQQASEGTEHRQGSPQQISYAQKLGIESRASLRKRRSLVLSEDDHTPTPVEGVQEDSQLAKVPLRKKVQNLQLTSIMAERALDSPRPASLVLDRDILKTDPSKWSIDEVCQWLELIGLGAFRQAFRERGVNGALLLQIDVQLFDELGVDSHEIRELFLAKIYELSNPRFSVGGMEDDFRLAVDDYTSEDWKKFQAAVSVLKSPILGDSVELEPSAIGEYLHTEYIRSHSTPNISKITDLPDNNMPPGRQHTSPGTYFVFPSPIGPDDGHSGMPYTGDFPGSVPLAVTHNRWRRKSEPSNTPILDKMLDLSHNTSGDERLAEWVADLPENGCGRARALTAPSRGTIKDHSKLASESEKKGAQVSKTLPRDLNISVETASDHVATSGRGIGSKEEAKISPTAQKSPVKQTPKKEKRRSRQQSSSSKVSESSSPGLPGLIRLHMDTIQKGAHYKSFMANDGTTAEQLVMQALEKIDIGSQDHTNFCIVEKTVGENGQPQRKALKPTQPILAVQSLWPQGEGYCLELRRRRLPQQAKGGAPPPQQPADAPNQSEAAGSKIGPADEHVQSLQSQLDALKLQLESKEGLEEKLKNLQDENAELTGKLQALKENERATSSELQEKLDTLNLEKQRLEDQVLVLKAAAVDPTDEVAGDNEDPTRLLEQVQARYEVQVNSLTSELRDKEKMEQEMNTKISEMEGKMAELIEKSSELNMKNRLLGERNQQLHSLEKDLAMKEETIQKLRVQLEEAHLSADQMLAYQKTLQAMEMASKQQQEFSNRTIKDLQEQLSRLSIESSQQEQLAQMVRNERDRLVRDQQAKDAFIASLEADITSYQTLSDATTTESSRIQALQRSLSVHEVAIASLRGEFQRQSSELKLAEEEVSRLRKSLAKKEQQLFLLSEEPSRTCFFDVLSHLPPHTFVTAEILPSPSRDSEGSEGSIGREGEGGGEGSVIQVMSAPGVAAAVGGSVVVSVPKHLQGSGIQPRDWMLEINGTNVASKSHRETNKLLLHHHQQGAVMKMVVARPLNSFSPDNSRLAPPDNEDTETTSTEHYQKLNASLNAKLEFQSAEVDHWKQECERLRDEILRYSIAQQDKDSELKYLQSALQELKYQLEDSEKARLQLEETDRGASHPNMAELEANLKKKETELKRIKAAEKARVAELKKLQKEKDKAVQVLREHMIASEDVHGALGDHTQPQVEGSLSKASRSELVKRLRNLEEEFSRHKAYLDQLLTIIIDQHPELLSMLGEAQRLRDQMEADADSWC